MAYRKARCIELHEAGTAFAVYDDSYSFAYLPGRGEEATRPAFKIPLLDIIKAAEPFGFSVDSNGWANTGGMAAGRRTHQTMVDAYRLGETKVEVVQYGDYEINVFRHYEDVGGEATEFEIVSLEADIQAANLINIKIGLKWREGGPSESEMTYSGTFTVWWSDGEN